MYSVLQYSVIVPVYNEEDNIHELHQRLTEVMTQLCHDSELSPDCYEIILVDDGSTDRSWEFIKSINSSDPRLKGIRFSRNFGHHAAVLSGLDAAGGEYLVFLDGDLQDPPEEIPKLIHKIKEGYDVVQGVSSWRHKNPLRNLVSLLFHKIFVTLSNINPSTKLGLFRCVNRRVTDSLKELQERTIFLGGLVSWVGFRTAHVDVNRMKRHAGRSKYNVIKRFALAMNAITSFSERPLVLIFQLGLFVFAFSIFMFCFAVYRKLFHGIALIGWTSLFSAIFFSTGLITLSLSVIGIYISKLFIEIKQRPRFIVRDKTDNLISK